VPDGLEEARSLQDMRDISQSTERGLTRSSRALAHDDSNPPVFCLSVANSQSLCKYPEGTALPL
jgi:hypothetical protein